MRSRLVEVELYSFLKSKGAASYLLAVSGGADSMALLHAFYEIQPKLGFKVAVAHIHHGGRTNNKYRDRVWKFVKKECEWRGIPFFSNKKTSKEQISGVGSSEAELRKYRLEELRKIWKVTGAKYVVLAQHADDLFETRLIRLIRGVGTEGLSAMRRERGALLRPFLRLTKNDLREYLQKVQAVWCEDPSNQDTHYLRNWLRSQWLPQLEQRAPGGLRSFARSLMLLSQAQGDIDAGYIEEKKLIRPVLLQFSESDKRRAVARYFGQNGFRDFGLSHVNELLKRLDVEQNELTFRLLKKNWRANARHIWFEE